MDATEAERRQLAKALVHEFVLSVVLRGDAEALAWIVDPEFVDHSTAMAPGCEGLLEAQRAGRLRAPHLAGDRSTLLEPEFAVSEGDLVTVGTCLPQPLPDGGAFDYIHFDTYRLREGRIAEHWSGAHPLAELVWHRDRREAVHPAPAGAETDPATLERNKRRVVDSFRCVWDAENAGAVPDFYAEDYRQHMPGVPDGREPLVEMIRKGFPDGPKPVPDEPLVPPAILSAEGDLVIYATPRPQPDPDRPGERLPYLVFNAFRVENGMLAEHWSGLNPTVSLQLE